MYFVSLGKVCAWQTVVVRASSGQSLMHLAHAASTASWHSSAAGGRWYPAASAGAYDVAPGLAGVGGLRAQLLLDAQQLVVLGQPLRPGACNNAFKIRAERVGDNGLRGSAKIRCRGSGMRIPAANNQEQPLGTAPAAWKLHLAACLSQRQASHTILTCLVTRRLASLATKRSIICGQAVSKLR